ncbi:MAG: hypothetical protein LUC24_00660 [Bacteroidales bacterium]|nr:hypothetical protein [Bacteroidales bacterium]
MERDRYKLTRTEVSKGWLYQVIDTKDGKVVRQRRSARNYVAAAVFYDYFYGRRDLVCKGGRVKMLNDSRARLAKAQSDDEKEHWRKIAERYEQVTYLDE